jgi:hypothetical protein
MSELVTRAILKEELQKALEKGFDEFEERFERKLDAKLDARFEEFRLLVQQDTQSAMRMVMADFQRSMGLALEPTKDLPERVAKLEQADLPDRVTRLEAKVFPPKRASRRR